MVDHDQDRLCRQLREIVGDRAIHLVGNSAALLSTRHGAMIEDGCVMRLNCGVPINRTAQGRRVDIHCFTTRDSFVRNMAKASWRVRLRKHYFDNAFSVWMSGAERETCIIPDQAFYPLEMLQNLETALGAPPSVGIRALDMVVNLLTNKVLLFGFDFKQSTTFYRKRENRGPHDWASERGYVERLAAEERVKVVT